MKKLAILLCVAALMSLAACGADQVTETDPGENQTQSVTETVAPEENQAVTMDPVVLVEQNGIAITAKGLVEDEIWGPGIQILVENQSDKNVSVYCDTAVVNRYTISPLFVSSVSAGKKANETLYFGDTNLEAAGITTIADVALSLRVVDDDTYDTLLDCPDISLETSASGTIDQPALDQGKELVNQDGIRIVGRYVEEDSFWGAGVVLFLENSTDKNVVVQCDNMSINGFMVTPYFSASVNGGCMAVSSITILSTDLEENGITQVEDLALTFRVAEVDSYQTIFETEEVQFSTVE